MRTIVVDPARPDPEALKPAASVILDGGLVAFPTETVYGLGALALDARAATKIFTAKGRPAEDPLIVHVRPHWDLERVVRNVDDRIRDLTDRYWPGPLTLVVERSDEVPDVVTSGRSTVAVRAPSHPVARLLLDLVGEPVAAPSANRFSYVSPTTAEHVAADLGDVIDVLIDAGPTPVGIESTIVRVEDDRLVLLRPGSVVIPDAVVDAHSHISESPGRLDVHYSPTAPTRALPAGGSVQQGESGTVIGYDDSTPPPSGWEVVSLGSRHDLEAVARALYQVLRSVDLRAPTQIVIEFTGLPGLGEAIDDRIRRAAGGQIVT